MLATRLTTHPAAARFFSPAKAADPKKPNLLGPFALIVTPFIVGLSYWWPYQKYNPTVTVLFAAICYILGLVACNKAVGKNPGFVLTMFTLKFLSAYLILWFGWFGTDTWDRTEVYMAFDPATYDAFAAWLVDSGEPLHNFMTKEEQGNYVYTVNLYATLYSYLGASVLNAASFNSLLVALSYYFFYRVALSLGAKENVSLYLSWLFIIPEVIYFTAMPGKEASSLAVAGALTFLVFDMRKLKDLIKVEYVVALAVVGLLAGVRKHIPVTVLSVSLIIRLTTSFKIRRPILMAATLFYLMITAGAILSTNVFDKEIRDYFLGGLTFKEQEVTETIKGLEERHELLFSSTSITRRFIPYTVMQTIFYLPIRTGFYFISPFPPRFLQWKNDSIGDWVAQGYVTSFLAASGLISRS